MRAFLLALLAPLTPLAAQAVQSQSFYNGNRSFRIGLPDDWRRLTPDEALSLRPKLPVDLHMLPIPGSSYRLAAVDRWLQQGVDGICLSITELEGEPAMDETTLQLVREHAARATSEEFSLKILRCALAKLSGTGHPVVEAEVEVRDPADRVIARRLEFLVPTGGESLRFVFRANAEDFAAQLPRFHEIIGSLECAKPAEGPEELSDMLQTSLFVGGLVGIVLVLLYKGRKP